MGHFCFHACSKIKIVCVGMIVISKTLHIFFPMILLQVLTAASWFLTTYQAMSKAKPLLTACLSHSSSLSGSHMEENATMPMVPLCFAWISMSSLLIKLPSWNLILFPPT